MTFGEPHLELEFDVGLDSEVRLTVLALDAWSQENGIPGPVVTHVLRAPVESERIYTRYADGLIYKLKAGVELRDADRALAVELVKLTRDEVMAWARNRFSWHRVGQAVDLRNRHYSADELDRVMSFLAKRCPRPAWELLQHDVSGAHIHVARRDPAKRKTVH